jgi:hypothetical protein
MQGASISDQGREPEVPLFGAARRWFQTLDRIPAEEMAAKIETMVGPVFLSGYE